MTAVECNSSDVQATNSEAVPLRRKRRAQSVDSAQRQYIAPDELRSTIENLRNTLGK